jgi:hypothetical protein
MVYLKMLSELLAAMPKGTHQRPQSEDQTFESEIIQLCPSGWMCRVLWLPFVKCRMQCLTNGSLEFTYMLRLLLPSTRNQWQFNRKQDATQRISRNISLLPLKSHFYARTRRLKDSITWPYTGSSKHRHFTNFSKQSLDKNLLWSRTSLYEITYVYIDNKSSSFSAYPWITPAINCRVIFLWIMNW